MVGYGINDLGNISNSYYNIEQVLINGGHHITIGGIYNGQYQDWFSHNKTLNIANYASISGLDSNGYYGINSVQGLKDMLGFVEDNSAGYKFKLSNNLDLAGNAGFFIPYFTGEFDGVNHTISNLAVNTPFIRDFGMFGYNKGTINNLGVTNSSLIGGDEVGGLVGLNLGYATISNSYTTGSVRGTSSVGGLVGYSYYNNSNISNSYSTSRVSGTNDVGGLVGDNSGYATISNSYATGNVIGINGVGGLVGGNGGYIIDSYATGSVRGTNDIGGLIGNSYGYITNSYAIGNVSGTNNVGGLIGNLMINSDYVSNIISNSFWNTITTGQANAIGFNAGGTVTNVVGKTTAELQQMATFSNLGWYIANTGGSNAVWRIYEGQTTPLLRSFLTPLTVTASNQTSTYNGLAYTGGLIASYSVAGADTSGHLFNINTAYNNATHAGIYNTAPNLYSDQQGYDINYINGSLTINPATLTYTADTANRVYGAANPDFTGMVTGFMNGETLATATTGALGFFSLANNTSPAGSYLISGSGLSANYGNYNFVQAAANNIAAPVSTPTPAHQALVLSDNRFNVDLQSQRVPLQTSTTLTGQNRDIEKTDVSHTESNISIEGGGIKLP